MTFPVKPINFGHSIWVGATGKRYVFEVFDFNVGFWDRPGCFIVVRGMNTPVFFGGLESLATLKDNFPARLHDDRFHPHYLHVRLSSQHRYERLYEVRDLKAQWLPGCG